MALLNEILTITTLCKQHAYIYIAWEEQRDGRIWIEPTECLNPKWANCFGKLRPLWSSNLNTCLNYGLSSYNEEQKCMLIQLLNRYHHLQMCLDLSIALRSRCSGRRGTSHFNAEFTNNGQKQIHCMMYRTISTLGGLMFALYGQEAGSFHDLTLYYNSGWDQILEQALLINGRQYYIFGEKPYLIRPWLQRPFLLVNELSSEASFNTKMSSVRVSVEKNYRDVKQFWISQDFLRNLWIIQAPLAVLYKGSAIMNNFHVCLYKYGQNVHRFAVQPPSLDVFLNSQ